MMQTIKGNPIDLTKGVAWIKTESNAILILVIYLCGVTAGAILAALSAAVRTAAGDSLLHLTGTATPFTLFLTGALLTIVIATAVYGAGLCLIGYPCIYAVPLLLGVAGGTAFSVWLYSGDTLAVVKCLLVLPGYGALVCCMQMLCKYAAEMNGVLLAARGGREAAAEKKYAARFLILGGVMLLLCLAMAMSVVLLRHLQ